MINRNFIYNLKYIIKKLKSLYDYEIISKFETRHLDLIIKRLKTIKLDLQSLCNNYIRF